MPSDALKPKVPFSTGEQSFPPDAGACNLSSARRPTVLGAPRGARVGIRRVEDARGRMDPVLIRPKAQLAHWLSAKLDLIIQTGKMLSKSHKKLDSCLTFTGGLQANRGFLFEVCHVDMYIHTCIYIYIYIIYIQYGENACLLQQTSQKAPFAAADVHMSQKGPQASNISLLEKTQNTCVQLKKEYIPIKTDVGR